MKKNISTQGKLDFSSAPLFSIMLAATSTRLVLQYSDYLHLVVGVPVRYSSGEPASARIRSLAEDVGVSRDLWPDPGRRWWFLAFLPNLGDPIGAEGARVSFLRCEIRFLMALSKPHTRRLPLPA